jgi:hypothetical protein
VQQSVHTPRAGDIGLTIITGWVGALIRAGQWLTLDGAPYQHAFLVVTDQGKTVEAMPGGARYNKLGNYDHRHTVYVRVDMGEMQRWAVAAAGLRMMDPPVAYSFLQYPSLTLLALGIKPPRLRRFIKGRGHVICSQLVDVAFQQADVQLFDDERDPGDVTPGDLYRHMTAPNRHFTWPSGSPDPAGR